MRRIEELSDRFRGYDSSSYSKYKPTYFSRSSRGSLTDTLLSDDMIKLYVATTFIFAMLGAAVQYTG